MPDRQLYRYKYNVKFSLLALRYFTHLVSPNTAQ